ncbi:protein-lysine N-methyltransferase SMYD4-like isoform X2 [Lasioglossum baleicum]|uniref:protein-lysine N-methyltransferase SMYD4-like isoform X2 n=1 Tax=Lasioglossum baleicum TaxID=434251 RepID=UPI003FCE47A9
MTETELVSDCKEQRCNTKESKSTIKAQLLKTIGNQQFQAKNYLESIESYTQCAMYAPEHSREYSVAIANRSASLFFLNRYKDCMKDIDLAIVLNCPKKLHYKLHLRKVLCYVKLGNTDLAKQMISKIRESIDDPSYIAPSTKDDIERRISRIPFNGPCTPDQSKNSDDPLDLRSVLTFDENPNFPHASSSIDRKFNEELGRHVVANRFIRKGEVLFIEKPVSFAFENEDIAGRTCHHCCRSTDIPVPCSKCLNTFYCDTNCLNEAWSSYHRWECLANQMGLWDWGGQLALKVLLVCTTTMDTIKFNEIQNLVTHFDKQSIEELITYGCIAMMLTTYLLKHTDFFQKNDLNDFARKFVDNSFNSNFHAITDDNKHIYVSSLLLRYILQLIYNGTTIYKTSVFWNLNPLSIGLDSKTDALGKAVYLSASMMNHSCDPNTVINVMDQYQIVRAFKDIAANEEILTCYGVHYRDKSPEERRKELLSLHHFTCKCTPCTEPNLKYFLERFNAMNCSKCNGALCNIKNSLFCLDCSDKPKHRPPYFHQDKIKKSEKLFKEAKSHVDQQNVEVALKKLKECLNIRRTMLYKSSEPVAAALYFISKLYVANGKLTDAKKCGESLIAIIIERFGPSSIELLNTLFKLVNVALPYLALTRDTTTRSYRAVLGTTYEFLVQIQDLVDLNYGPWTNIDTVFKFDTDALLNMLLSSLTIQ